MEVLVSLPLLQTSAKFPVAGRAHGGGSGKLTPDAKIDFFKKAFECILFWYLFNKVFN